MASKAPDNRKSNFVSRIKIMGLPMKSRPPRDSAPSSSQSNFVVPPLYFCWTKMAAEAGQSLADIIHRKELERQAGQGFFGWGIGSSLGTSPAAASALMGVGLEVYFSRMKSKPKAIDSSPTAKALWLSYLDADGNEHPLPAHILITSRAILPNGENKKQHYALLCKTDQTLSLDDQVTYFDSKLGRNFISNNVIGASQVTSIVRYSDRFRPGKVDPYNVAFTARLIDGVNGFVKLVKPVRLDGDLLAAYEKACLSSDSIEWLLNVERLKALASDRWGSKLRSTLELFKKD